MSQGAAGNIPTPAAAPFIRLNRVSKTFGHVCALKYINFEVGTNEVVALLGDNGAGKTSLVNILCGVENADSGTIEINGTPVGLNKFNVAKARSCGIETVHQDRALGEKQSIWRNFFMGRHLTNRLGLIRKKKERQVTVNVLTNILGLDGAGVSDNAPVSVLSGGERQGLAIGRAIYFDAGLIILDEPCTALAIREVEKVLSFIRDIRDRGRSAIFISHNLAQAFEVADRFVLLHHGQVTGCVNKSDTSLPELTRTLMEMEGGR